jgi:hypothetical protein
MIDRHTSMRPEMRPGTIWLGILGLILTAGCNTLEAQYSEPYSDAEPSAVEAAAPPTTAPADPPSASEPDRFSEAVNAASSAFQLGQSARSQDDWRLVAQRWRQAVELLTTVPESSPNHATAQTKIAEYRRNLTYAEQQANQPITQAPSAIAVSPSRNQPATNPANPSNPSVSRSAPPAPARPPSNSASPPASSPSPSASALRADTDPTVFVAPIVARAGGTPVINVTFNNSAVFPMIVDTGASGTLITADMAAILGVEPAGEARVDTASQRNLRLPLGYVQTMEVEGAIATDLLVAIAGPELDLGLLGHDFFGDYDITVRQDVVEFRER